MQRALRDRPPSELPDEALRLLVTDERDPSGIPDDVDSARLYGVIRS